MQGSHYIDTALRSISLDRWLVAINKIKRECEPGVKALDKAAVSNILNQVKTHWSLYVDVMLWNNYQPPANIDKDRVGGHTFQKEKRILMNPYLHRPGSAWDSTLRHEVAHAVFYTAGVPSEKFCNITNEMALITAHHKIMRETGIDPNPSPIL